MLSMVKTAEINHKLLDAPTYFSDLSQQILNSTQQVWIQTMYFEPGTITGTLLKALIKAAQNKVDVRLHIDWFGLATTDPNLNVVAQALLTKPGQASRQKLHQKKLTLLRDLEKSGVKIYFTNPPNFANKLLPYWKRNHVKLSIVDTTIYIGSCNISDDDARYINTMVKINDHHLTNLLQSFFLYFEGNAPLPPTHTKVDQLTTIVFDNGQTEHSPIRDEVFRAVSSAKKSVTYVSQFSPDWQLLMQLEAARAQNVKVEIIVPQKNTFNSLFSSHQVLNYMLAKLASPHLPQKKLAEMIHAKLLLVDNQTVIFGSHNFNSSGVLMGTTELALISHRAELVTQFVKFVEDL